MARPPRPQIYHIVHVDRLASIVRWDLLSDSAVRARKLGGANIGMPSIKSWRASAELDCHPGLYVGDCVPFYFCPRPVMLRVIHTGDPELEYKGGQAPIVHLQADLRRAVDWADWVRRRWAFTLSNAGAREFEDRCDLRHLDEIDWEAVEAPHWHSYPGSFNFKQWKHGKQAEFLMEACFPWQLITRIGVMSEQYRQEAIRSIQASGHRPPVEIERDWYF